jgi:hypothetical protein
MTYVCCRITTIPENLYEQSSRSIIYIILSRLHNPTNKDVAEKKKSYKIRVAFITAVGFVPGAYNVGLAYRAPVRALTAVLICSVEKEETNNKNKYY